MLRGNLDEKCHGGHKLCLDFREALAACYPADGAAILETASCNGYSASCILAESLEEIFLINDASIPRTDDEDFRASLLEVIKDSENEACLVFSNVAFFMKNHHVC